jgi:hypothetical protein
MTRTRVGSAEDIVRGILVLRQRGARFANRAVVTNARRVARGERRVGPLLHFCDGPVPHALGQVARPGSLALAPLPAVGATLIAPR